MISKDAIFFLPLLNLSSFITERSCFLTAIPVKVIFMYYIFLDCHELKEMSLRLHPLFCHTRENSVCCLLLSAVGSVLAQHLLIFSELWNFSLSILPSHTVITNPRGQINISTSEAVSLKQEHMGKSKRFKKSIYYMGSLARPYINSESASKHLTSLRTVKSTWLWEKVGTHWNCIRWVCHTFWHSIYSSESSEGSITCWLSFLLSVSHGMHFISPSRPYHKMPQSQLLPFGTNLLTALLSNRQSWCQRHVIFTVSLG